MKSSRLAPVRLVTSLVLVLLVPPLAWLVWIAPTDSHSDARNVAWFVTVAVSCVLAGVVAGPATRYHQVGPVAVLSTLVTLWLWWSSEDESGLFAIGIIIAAPLVTAASAPLLWLGRTLGSLGRRAAQV